VEANEPNLTSVRSNGTHMSIKNFQPIRERIGGGGDLWHVVIG